MSQQESAEITESIRESRQLKTRCLFSAALIGAMYLYSRANGGVRVDCLGDDDCLVDQTFIWTDSLNTFSTQHLWFRDFTVLLSNFIFDISVFGLLLLFYLDVFHSVQIFIAITINATLKTAVENYGFQMAKPKGFIWYFNGLYSLVCPSFDIDDFYFSGHVAIAVTYTLILYKVSKRHPDETALKYAFRFWLLIGLPYLWGLLTMLYAHFVIDMLSAVAISIVSMRLSEKVSYYGEVKCLGLRAEDRDFLFYQACPECGWANRKALDMIDADEQRWQSFVRRASARRHASTIDKEGQPIDRLAYEPLSIKED